MRSFGLSYLSDGLNFVIIADQKEYKINIRIQTIAILRMVLMVGVILLKRRYHDLLIEGRRCLSSNFIARRIALKNYPWLKENKRLAYDDAFQKNAKYTIIQRLSTLATNNTDNLVITFFATSTMTSVYRLLQLSDRAQSQDHQFRDHLADQQLRQSV